MKYNEEIKLVATSCESDSSRFEIVPHQPLELDSRWKLDVLEFAIPNDIAYIDQDKDYIEIIQQTKIRSRRDVRRRETPHERIEISSLEEPPITIGTYFPWFGDVIKNGRGNQSALFEWIYSQANLQVFDPARVRITTA